MVAIAHIQKFIKDNPTLFGRGRGEQVLRKAFSLGDAPILAQQAREILGKDAEVLLGLIGTDRAYIKISFEEAGRIGSKKS